MCTVLLPPGVNPIAVKYIVYQHVISYRISYHISYHYFISYQIRNATNAKAYWVERKLGSLLIYFDFRLPSNRVRNRSLWIKNKILYSVPPPVGRDSSVGIAICYGLDGLGIESRWGVRFCAPVQTALGGPPNLLYSGYRVFPGDKAAGAWRWPPTLI
jgi:hypothetical protein